MIHAALRGAPRAAPIALVKNLIRTRPTPTLRLQLHHARRYASVMVKVPTMAESLTEGTLRSLTKKIGDYVNEDDEVATIETDKVDVSVNAPASGTIQELFVNEEDTVTVGQDLMRIEVGEEGKPTSDQDQPTKKTDESQDTGKSQSDTSADRPGPDDAEPASSSPDKSSSAAPKQTSKPEPKPEKTQKSEPEPNASPATLGSRVERRVKMNRMRQRTAERLKTSQNNAAFLTTFAEVDMSEVIELRAKYKDEFLSQTGVKLGFMGFFARACTLAMRDFPAVNASVEGPGHGDTIVFHDFVDISIAVATEKGLVTPVVRNVEALDILGIEKSIAELGSKARKGKLTIEEMAGGTFTISNGGVFGSLMGTPIINLPQTAVLGLHAIKDRAVVVNGKIEARPMMYLALTYDHRLLDGREAVSFLVKVVQYVQHPGKMLLL